MNDIMQTPLEALEAQSAGLLGLQGFPSPALSEHAKTTSNALNININIESPPNPTPNATEYSDTTILQRLPMKFEWSRTAIPLLLSCLDTELLREANITHPDLLASTCYKGTGNFNFDALHDILEEAGHTKLHEFLTLCAVYFPLGIEEKCSLPCKGFIGLTTGSIDAQQFAASYATNRDSESAHHHQILLGHWQRDVAQILEETMAEYDFNVDHQGLPKLEIAQRCFMLMCRQIHLLEIGQPSVDKHLQVTTSLATSEAEGSVTSGGDIGLEEISENVQGQDDKTAEILQMDARQLFGVDRSALGGDATVDDLFSARSAESQGNGSDDLTNVETEEAGLADLEGYAPGASAGESNTEAAVSAKRGRGRPRKIETLKSRCTRSTIVAPPTTTRGSRSIVPTAASTRSRRSSLSTLLGPNTKNAKVIKRGPGRPRKVTIPQTAPISRPNGGASRGRPVRLDGSRRSARLSSSVIAIAPGTPSKRGPGRPRKEPERVSPRVIITPKRELGRPREDTKRDHVSPMVVVTPKRGPGRPKKNATVISPTPERRGRGRPRKVI